MKWNSLVKRLRYYLQYFPFSFNAIILGLVLWICFRIIKPGDIRNGEEPSSFSPLIWLMGETALWFILALIGFSVITTFLCWLYFLLYQRKHPDQLEFLFKPAE